MPSPKKPTDRLSMEVIARTRRFCFENYGLLYDKYLSPCDQWFSKTAFTKAMHGDLLTEERIRAITFRLHRAEALIDRDRTDSPPVSLVPRKIVDSLAEEHVLEYLDVTGQGTGQ